MATKLPKYIITNTIYYFQYSIASTFLDIIIRIHAKQLSWYSCLLQKVWCTPTCWHFKSTYTQHRQLDVYTCSTSLCLYIFLILQVKLPQHCGTMYTLKSWSYESNIYWYKLPMKKIKTKLWMWVLPHTKVISNICTTTYHMLAMKHYCGIVNKQIRIHCIEVHCSK
jgi:hypothetical protein